MNSVAGWGVYLVTDRAQTNGRPLLEVVTAALRGGVGAVQLRERGLTTRELLALATALRAATRAVGAALLINDRVDVALACDADGVHLPGHSFAVAEARALLGPRRLIGVSTTIPTRSSRHLALDRRRFRRARTIFAPKARRRRPAWPVYRPARARGGARCRCCHRRAGCRPGPSRPRPAARGVAVIRAVLSADDPARAAAAAEPAPRDSRLGGRRGSAPLLGGCSRCGAPSSAGAADGLQLPARPARVGGGAVLGAADGARAKLRIHQRRRASTNGRPTPATGASAQFCDACGSRIAHGQLPSSGVLSVRSGTLDDRSWVEPVGDIWIRSAQPWVPRSAERLQVEQQPTDYAPFLERFQRQGRF
ncbi:MAG: thiamine phosphate synthase [Candidatus Binatia bacterium]